MGVLFSCPVDDETAVVEDAAPVAEQAVLKASLGSGGRLRIEGSLSFKTREQQSLQVETKIPAVTSPRAAPAPMPRELLRTRFADAAAAAAPESPKHEAAAVTLQKVYKSFRTRRRLADCAVLVEQSWWKLLDFALLKRSSVSFFDIEKQESAVSKWARARTRAAKVRAFHGFTPQFVYCKSWSMASSSSRFISAQLISDFHPNSGWKGVVQG
jgi:hypothetical protein